MGAPGGLQEEQGLTPEQIEALKPYGREFGLQTGDLLFDERSVVDSFYVVLEGEVEISRLDGAGETPVLNHGPGEFTGGPTASRRSSRPWASSRPALPTN